MLHQTFIISQAECCSDSHRNGLFFLVDLGHSSCISEWFGTKHRIKCKKSRNCWTLKRLLNLPFDVFISRLQFQTSLTLSEFIKLPSIHSINPRSLTVSLWMYRHSCTWRVQGPVTPVLYSWLARSLRSLAIVLPIHRHLQSLGSTFATIFTQLLYVSLRSRVQTYVPLHYYRSSVNGYVSLTGFASLPLFRQWRIRNQQSQIHVDMSPEAWRLHKRWVLRCSSFNQVIDGSRNGSDDQMATEMCHSQYWQFLWVPRN